MNVTVKFIGICAHINNQLLFPPGGGVAIAGSATRVVLPNASQGFRVADTAVSPHIAKMYIPAPFIANAPATIGGLELIHDELGDSWKLNGVQLELANVSAGLTLADSYCLPSLTQTAGEGELPLSDAMVQDGAAACVFKIVGGTLDAYKHGDAVLGKLTVVTDSPAELVVTQIWNQEVGTISLQSAMIGQTQFDPVIFVMNTGSEIDSSVDFLLHYRVTTFMPDHPLQPQFACPSREATDSERAMLKLLNSELEGLTIGCSNSVYP